MCVYVCVCLLTHICVCPQELVDQFQHRDSVRAAVLSITAAGAGITLTAAGLVVFAELHWNPGVSARVCA